MSGISVHDLPVQVATLSQRLRTVLTQLGGPEAAVLSERLTFPERDKPSLVFTGQYSSGKSTLISALTNASAAVDIAVDIATDRVTEYDWDGAVTLVDTPGVKAGVRQHDQIAEAAIAAGDLVLFCVTVELFDDAGAEHLQHVVTELDKREQLLVVITKSSMMSGAFEMRREAVLAELGPGVQPDIVLCDAKNYLIGLKHADPAKGARYMASSGLDDVREAINNLSEERNQLAALRQPFQVIKAAGMEAQGLLTEDPAERSALRVLARQREALSTRRRRIETALEQLEGRFRLGSVEAAELFATDVENLDDIEEGQSRDDKVQAALDAFYERLTTVGQRLAEDAERMLQQQFDDLTAEILEIEAGPHAQALERLRSQHVTWGGSARPTLEIPPTRESGGGTPSWLNDMTGHLKSFNAMWGAGDGVSASAGSVGHKIVYKVGSTFGHKFRPWQAVRWADNIGKVARGAAVAIPILTAGAGFLIEERARLKAEQQRRARRASLIRAVGAQADAIALDVIRQVHAILDPQFEQAYEGIDRVHGEIVRSQEQRSAHQQEIASILQDCDHALQSGNAPAPEG